MKRNTFMIIAVCMIMIFITACGNNEPNNIPVEPDTSIGEPDTETEVEIEVETETITFTDSAGRQVELPSNITRIVPSGPLAQIALFAIAPDLFVGLASDWSPEAEQYLDTEYYNLQVLGQFYGKGDLNLEEIAKADPQVIIDIGDAKSSIVEDMDGITDQLGIPTVHIDARLETMGDAYRMLGKLLGREEEGEILAQYCEEVYNKTLNIVEKAGQEGKANLIYSIGLEGLSVLAKDSYHAEIIDMVSNNVAVVEDISNKGTGNPVDMEQLLLWDPDIIIVDPSSDYSLIGGSDTWQQLKAIKNGTYYQVPMGPYNWLGTPPSVNRYMGMIWITQLLYPEEAQYDLYEETAKYYELFYHTELTREQYDALVENAI